MDVMEVLIKVKFASIPVVVFLSASCCFGQETKTVENIKGEWIISNDITPLQAREKALSQAKAEALRQAGVAEYVNASDLTYKTETNNKLKDIHESWTS